MGRPATYNFPHPTAGTGRIGQATARTSDGRVRRRGTETVNAADVDKFPTAAGSGGRLGILPPGLVAVGKRIKSKKNQTGVKSRIHMLKGSKHEILPRGDTVSMPLQQGHMPMI